MPRHRNLTPKKFLDALPTSLLQEYFEHHPGPRIEPLPTAYDSETIQNYLDSLENETLKTNLLEEFHCINDVCENGTFYLVEARQRAGIPSEDDQPQEISAMDLFLHHSEVFEDAFDHFCITNAPGNISHFNIEVSNLEITPDKVELFKAEIMNFFSQAEMGHKCEVRSYDDGDKYVLVIQRGSYLKSHSVWRGDQIKTEFFRRAEEDILQFDRITSNLSIRAPFPKEKEAYLKAFVRTIVQDEEQAKHDDRDSTYSLEPLQNGTFNFLGNESITGISLTSVRMAIGGLNHTTIEIKSSNIMNSLDDDLEHRTPLNMGQLLKARFQFRIKFGGKIKKVTYEVTPPNTTKLSKKKYADIIEAYLKENGVKLK
jgi:hypothetical protein